MAGTKRSGWNRFFCFSSSASDEEGQDHPASAGPSSLPSAIDNTTETLLGPPKRSEAPIPGSSNVVTPRKDEDEDGQDHPASAGRRSSPCAIDNTTDEGGQEHPASASPRSSSSAIDNTTETLPGPPERSEAPIPGSSIDLRRSRMYPAHAVGIEESIEEVLSLLECESAQNAVTVILHGFGAMGKTTLADAVVSRVRGYRYSHVQLFEDIDSIPNITKLQERILKDLMEPEEPVPDIKNYQNGQGELGERLEKMEAFIYIDNVVEGAALQQLLPMDMTTAKKVRLLVTTRNEDVKNSCPRQCTKPKIYKMHEIQSQAALTILKREIGDGINDSQFNDIIQTCGRIPFVLDVVARYIGRADNKAEAYAKLMEQTEKRTDQEILTMHRIQSQLEKELPHECKDRLLDICTYFDGWKWDIVEDIVGQYDLGKLHNRALVNRTNDGFAHVHGVILEVALQMSKEESKGKEVRCKFTNASELKKFLEEGDTEGIRGIWLTERKDVPKKEEDDDDRKEVAVQASALDKFHKSLRFLQLGNSIKVEGTCNEIFKELVFFEAKISQLPFDYVSQLPQLRYLSCDIRRNWVPSSLPRFAIMNFNGKTFQTYK